MFERPDLILKTRPESIFMFVNRHSITSIVKIESLLLKDASLWYISTDHSTLKNPRINIYITQIKGKEQQIDTKQQINTHTHMCVCVC